MAAAGAEINLEAAESLSDCFGIEDQSFCKPLPKLPGLLRRLYQKLRNPVLIKDIPQKFYVKPFVNDLVALVVPTGQMLKIAPDRFKASRVLVIEIEGDKIAHPRFYARVIADMLTPAKLENLVSILGHHYAFIAPFSGRETDKKDIPVAKLPHRL